MQNAPVLMVLEHAGRLAHLRVEIRLRRKTDIVKRAKLVRNDFRVPGLGELDRDVCLVVQQVGLLGLDMHADLSPWMYGLEFA